MLLPKSKFVPNLKLLASTVADLNIEGKFWSAPVAQIPANFGPKSCCWHAIPCCRFSLYFVCDNFHDFHAILHEEDCELLIRMTTNGSRRFPAYIS